MKEDKDLEMMETGAKVVAALLREAWWRYRHSGAQQMRYDLLIKSGARAKLEQESDKEFVAFCERHYPLFGPTQDEHLTRVYQTAAKDPDIHKAVAELGERVVDKLERQDRDDPEN